MTRARRLALLLALCLAACGKKGPNQPPIRILPSPAQDLKVRQIGSVVRLSARLPMQRTDGTPLGAKAQVRVLRMRATETFRPGAVSSGYLERQFERGAQVVGTLAGEELRKAAPDGRLRFADTGALSAPAGGGRPSYLYSVLVIDEEGKRSPLPPPLLIAPSEAPPAPHDLKVETAEGEVRLSWKPGGTPPGGTAPTGAAAPAATPSSGVAGAGHLFNVYRKAKADTEDPEAPLNRQPIEGTTYVDKEFAYGETYRYVVRGLAGRQPPLRESTDSPEVEVRPVDIFPPQAPTGIAAAAEGGVIRIYWFPNSETDLAGYRIYRREAPNAEFQRSGEVGAAETSFADTTARPGVRYHYAVTAFDSATPPNESVRSEERSESLPVEGAPQATPGSAPGAAPAATPAPTPAPSATPAPAPTAAPRRRP